jgi:hypothetical protein
MPQFPAPSPAIEFTLQRALGGLPIPPADPFSAIIDKQLMPHYF